MVSGRWTDAWLQLEKAVSLIDGMQFSALHENKILRQSY